MEATAHLPKMVISKKQLMKLKEGILKYGVPNGIEIDLWVYLSIKLKKNVHSSMYAHLPSYQAT